MNYPRVRPLSYNRKRQVDIPTRPEVEDELTTNLGFCQKLYSRKPCILYVLVISLILSQAIQNAYCLIAYDCNNASANITAVSLRNIAPCPEIEKDYKEESQIIYVLQKQSIDYTQVFTCLMEITRLIFHCGMHSHVSAVHQSISTYVHQIGASGCKEIHKFHTYHGFYGHTLNNLKSNSTTTVSLTLAGKVYVDGTCKGSTYIEHGVTWDDVIVMASVKLTTQDYLTRIKMDINEISLQNGIVCPYLDEYCMDTTIGETIWNLERKGECERYTVIYHGPSSIVSTNQPAGDGINQKFAVVEQADKIFALKLIKKHETCGQQMWITEHPQLLVTTQLLFMPLTHYIYTDIDMTAYINSKFLYIEQAYKTTINNLAIHAINRRCILHREILKNRLAMATLAPHIISNFIKNNLGYIGKVSGEVLFILQCVPRIVQLRESTECYHELPVYANNETLFMAPLTRILQKHAEQIECSNLVPSMYYINNQWIGLAPHIIHGINPLKLAADEEPTLKFRQIQDLGSGGLYTPEDIRKVHAAMLFGTERKAINNILTRKVIGLEVEDQGISTLNLFNKNKRK